MAEFIPTSRGERYLLKDGHKCKVHVVNRKNATSTFWRCLHHKTCPAGITIRNADDEITNDANHTTHNHEADFAKIAVDKKIEELKGTMKSAYNASCISLEAGNRSTRLIHGCNNPTELDLSRCDIMNSPYPPPRPLVVLIEYIICVLP